MTKQDLPKPKRYRKGVPMQFVTEFVITVMAGDMFYENGRLQNPSWGKNWSIKTISDMIARHHLCFAVEIKGDG